MALTREQYQRFINGQCTEEEEIMILQYFSDHPEAMEEYLHAADWEAFTPGQRLHPVITEKVLQRIRRQITFITHRRKWLRGIAAAAVVTGAAALAWMVTQQHTGSIRTAPQAQQSSPAPVVYRNYRNTGNTTIRLVLDDSSTVQLRPGSSLHLRAGFDNNKRDVWLKGDARFHVAKDGRRPFTVYAAGTATTALGTSFRVAENSITHRVTVKLYSGKVMVRPYARAQAAFAPVYLQPGDELLYTAGNKPQVRSAPPQGENITGGSTANAGSQALVFRKQPLPAVLKALEQHFNIHITYSTKALSGIRVTAEFSDTDTPEQVLQTIALLNELTLEQDTSGRYTLKKN
jgi:ferric-dicitrate binding protein FerR (iron transport regulator)